MNPNVWGPTCWKLMFSAAFKLPPPRVVAMLLAHKHLLPCVHCRKSFCMYLDALPPSLGIDASSPESAAKFVWAIKDKVNSKIGQRALPYSQLCMKYKAFAQPFSRMDVVDLLCCMALQVESDEQVVAYVQLVGVYDELPPHGERSTLVVPWRCRTARRRRWAARAQVQERAVHRAGLPTLTREEALGIYRPPEPEPAASSSSRASRRRRSHNR